MTPLRPARDYRDLEVWQRSMRLARSARESSRQLPPAERYGLAGQIRRAAVSVPANIAEGSGRFSRLDYLRYLSIAGGSLRELETLLLLARDFGYVSNDEVSPALDLALRVGQTIGKVTSSLRAGTARAATRSR